MLPPHRWRELTSQAGRETPGLVVGEMVPTPIVPGMTPGLCTPRRMWKRPRACCSSTRSLGGSSASWALGQRLCGHVARNWLRANTLLHTSEPGPVRPVPATVSQTAQPLALMLGEWVESSGGREGVPRAAWADLWGRSQYYRALSTPSPSSTFPPGSERSCRVFRSSGPGSRRGASRGGGSCWLPSSSR